MKNVKSNKIFLLLLFGILFLNMANPFMGNYLLSKDYAVTIHGTSNLHSWDETVETVAGNCNINWNSDGTFNLETVNIKMNVHSIKSDMGSIMNNNTYRALKADANPEIIFTLNNPIKSIPIKSNEKAFSVKGNLTIAGITKNIDMQGKAFIQEQGKFAFEGTQTIKLTDYGIDPPTALFGTLKVGDERTIHFKTNFLINN